MTDMPFIELRRTDDQAIYVNPTAITVVSTNAEGQTTVVMSNGLAIATLYTVPTVMGLLRRAGHSYVSQGGIEP